MTFVPGRPTIALASFARSGSKENSKTEWSLSRVLEKEMAGFGIFCNVCQGFILAVCEMVFFPSFFRSVQFHSAGIYEVPQKQTAQPIPLEVLTIVTDHSWSISSERDQKLSRCENSRGKFNAHTDVGQLDSTSNNSTAQPLGRAIIFSSLRNEKQVRTRCGVNSYWNHLV